VLSHQLERGLWADALGGFEVITPE
jgi:hypothetical protein